MMGGVIIFILGFVLLVALFSAKYAEVQGRTLVPHGFVTMLDNSAESLKFFLKDLGRNARRVPPITLLVVRYFIHQAALWFARTANRLEKQAHAVADRVSHKHRFQRQLPRSTYLHKVAEGKKTDIDPTQK